MNTKKIALIGGPGTGKTTLIESLKQRGFCCMEEISRQVTLEAQDQGIDQLFLEDPLLFSQKLLEGRQRQFETANSSTEPYVFFDRGLPDVLAYMDYLNTPYPEEFNSICQRYLYDKVFILPPWKSIYQTDNERYESFEQALVIQQYLIQTYERYGYTLIEVPFGVVEQRVAFISSHLNSNE